MLYSLLDLLPYDKETRLTTIEMRIRVLRLLTFLYSSTEKAVNAIFTHQYDQFDAQVSENLCQIRAYQITQLIEQGNGSEAPKWHALLERTRRLAEQSHQTLEKFLALSKMRPSHYAKEINLCVKIEDFVNGHELNLEISKAEYFVIQTHVLSRYKLVGEHEISHGINYELICAEIGIASKTFIRKFVHHFQRNISKQSCQFIFSLLHELNTDIFDMALLKALYKQDEVGRHVISCYEVTEIILNHALKKEKPVKLRITQISPSEKREIDFTLKGSPSGRHFTLSNELSDQDIAPLLFRGYVEYQNTIHESREQYIERFLSVGFENVILCNMAQHPQYSGILLDQMKYNPYLHIETDEITQSYQDRLKNAEARFLKDKFLSKQYGCAQENPSLFLLTHVRCEHHKNQVVKLPPAATADLVYN